ncbi:MAG: alpha-galactosidase [Candidatus Cyclobacteriaceae bacterium M3_2C_046]
MIQKFQVFFGVFVLICLTSQAQMNDCQAYWHADTLILKNSVIEQKLIWKNGELHHLSLASKSEKLIFSDRIPSVAIFEQDAKITEANLEIVKVEDHYLYPDHLQAHIVTQYPGITLKRVFKIFPGAPAIACQYFYKDVKLQNKGASQILSDGVETAKAQSATDLKFSSYGLKNRHWRIDYVSFQDVTDNFNNLVKENHLIAYRYAQPLKANLLFARDQLTDKQFFILKESPLHHNQVNYPGADFMVSNKEISVTGVGIPFDPTQEWQPGYTVTTGMLTTTENRLVSLRKYVKASRQYGPQHEMILMNTWGDRGRDGKISEAFALREIAAGKKMGFTHLQLDDGWQKGLSKNSATSGGRLWSEWPEGSWEPNPERFSNGLEKTVEAAEKAGMKIGLWFNPTSANNFATWERDANVLLDYYKKYNIATFKIDGLQIPNKTAEQNLRKFFNKVMQEAEGQVVFNTDVTAGRRGGYFFYDEYGNIFVENRYTDWANYYPYQTLRNLWQLSRYVAPEKLQFEFLNKWRNTDKYPENDIFAPANYDFEYLFATTMMAQPLAWFEGSNLPEEAFQAATAIKKYQEIMADIHQGIILPIGKEPSGKSWTGFQSMNGNRGYLLVFRENHAENQQPIATHFAVGNQVKFTSVIGKGKDFESTIEEEGKLVVQLPEKNSYGLWTYELEK